MIVGEDILNSALIRGGGRQNLKNSTFDLSIGEIIPIGKVGAKQRQKSAPQVYYLEPREMIWVMSREEFNLGGGVTGLATLRTALTKAGVLALNVGVIDPFYRGPISTALINFSDRPRRIQVGDRFVRVLFLEHSDVAAFHHEDESKNGPSYLKYLEDVSYADFSKSFLNVPDYDDDFYKKRLISILWNGVAKTYVGKAVILYLIVTQLYLLHLGLWDYLVAWSTWLADTVKNLKPI